MKYQQLNAIVLEQVSLFLNFRECAVKPSDVDSVAACGVSKERAFALLFREQFSLLSDEVFAEYFRDNPRRLDRGAFEQNAYYSQIRFGSHVLEKWRLGWDSYRPYEVFVQDDFIYDGAKVIPNLGYFDEEFSFPAVYQGNRLWMSVTPNEINTMQYAIDRARGRVLTFGLGLGYFAFMCSRKPEVSVVTVVERDPAVIELFQKHILPQFNEARKIQIVQSDAFDYLASANASQHDFVFVDIYHDAGDGLPVYQKFKQQKDNFAAAEVHFWIEKTLKYYNNEI